MVRRSVGGDRDGGRAVGRAGYRQGIAGGLHPDTGSPGRLAGDQTQVQHRTKNSYTNALFRRIAARRGGKRAQAAVAHSLLVSAWHVLTTRTTYHDLGGDYFLTRDNPDHRRRRAIAQLERLGYNVTIEPRPA
jgi:hypothetical protein